MTFDEYSQLSEKLQATAFQRLDAYTPEPPTLAVNIINAFLIAYPRLGPVENISFGLGPGLGPFNALYVKTQKGDGKRVPSSFMGAIVLRANQSN